MKYYNRTMIVTVKVPRVYKGIQALKLKPIQI